MQDYLIIYKESSKRLLLVIISSDVNKKSLQVHKTRYFSVLLYQDLCKENRFNSYPYINIFATRYNVYHIPKCSVLRSINNTVYTIISSKTKVYIVNK